MPNQAFLKCNHGTIDLGKVCRSKHTHGQILKERNDWVLTDTCTTKLALF